MLFCEHDTFYKAANNTTTADPSFIEGHHKEQRM